MFDNINRILYWLCCLVFLDCVQSQFWLCGSTVLTRNAAVDFQGFPAVLNAERDNSSTRAPEGGYNASRHSAASELTCGSPSAIYCSLIHRLQSVYPSLPLKTARWLCQPSHPQFRAGLHMRSAAGSLHQVRANEKSRRLSNGKSARVFTDEKKRHCLHKKYATTAAWRDPILFIRLQGCDFRFVVSAGAQ